MNIKHNILFTTAVICTMASCKDKDIRLQYEDINEITIGVPKEPLTIIQRDTLRIKPNISIKDPNNDSYTYRWEVYKNNDLKSYEITPVNPPTTSTVLSTERELAKPIAVAPGEYFVQYTITDTKTGLKQFARYPLRVNGKFYEGWIVTANENKQAKVSFLRDDGVIFKDIIKSSNPDLSISGTALASYAGIQSNLEEVNVFTDKKMYRFSASDFGFKANSDGLFDIPQTSFGQPYYAVNSVNFDQYIISEGSIYATTTPYLGLTKYSDRFNGPEGYFLFPYIIAGTQFWVVVYDNHGKRFLHTSYNSRTLNTFPENKDASVAYDLSKVNKTMIGGDKGPNGEYYCIMKDDDAYYFLTVLPNAKQAAGILSKMTDAPEINKALFFAASETNKQLYYCSNNKVYLFDALSQKAQLIYTFPTSIQIKDMKMCKGPGWGKTNDKFNKQLAIATNNAGNGEIYLFDLEPIGQFKNNTYSLKQQGLGDIQHISYRIPNL